MKTLRPSTHFIAAVLQVFVWVPPLMFFYVSYSHSYAGSVHVTDTRFLRVWLITPIVAATLLAIFLWRTRRKGRFLTWTSAIGVVAGWLYGAALMLVHCGSTSIM